MDLPIVGGSLAAPPPPTPSGSPKRANNYDSTMASSHASPQGHSVSSNVKEVDYYLNPTELFRWINYRRWDGARARAQSHPDECETWIVSRHSSDGRVLWRHLPLHLVCMQREAASVVDEADDPNAMQSARQVEALIDLLLDMYPEGSSSPDDQGMLPLHLLLAKSEREPNERIVNLLLTSFPTAVDVHDKFGRTPYDILREQTKDGTSDQCKAAFRALKRARFVADRITATIKDGSASIVAAVKSESYNERDASQKIMVRLEEELSNSRKQLDVQTNRGRNGQEEVQRFKQHLASLEERLKISNMDVDVIRKERDTLMVENEALTGTIEGHDEEFQKSRQGAERNRQNDLDTISKYKSEVSTAKAMAEAVESQLRSRFTNEEFLSTSVQELDDQLTETKVRLEHMTKKSKHELEAVTADNTRLKWNIDEVTKKNLSLQTKLNEVSKQMASILSSHSAITSEHERLVDVAERQESDLLEAIRCERAQVMDSVQKQRRTLESALTEQERILEAALIKEEKLLGEAKQERSRGKAVVETLRKEFQEIRSAAADRERQKHAEIAANRKIKGRSSSSSTGSPVPPEPRITTSFQQRSRTTLRAPGKYQSTDTADGHLVRLLDERAAQNGPNENHRGNNSTMGPQFSPGSSSSTNDDGRRMGPPHYIHQPENMMSNNTSNLNSISHDRSHTLPKNPSRDTTPRHRLFDERSDQSKLDTYSLDEYSQGSESSNGGTYSDGSSGYVNERRERHVNERKISSSGPHNGAHYQQGGPSPRRSISDRNEFSRDRDRANLSYISESYGDESTLQ